jgi:hypothetical protein
VSARPFSADRAMVRVAVFVHTISTVVMQARRISSTRSECRLRVWQTSHCKSTMMQGGVDSRIRPELIKGGVGVA